MSTQQPTAQQPTAEPPPGVAGPDRHDNGGSATGNRPDRMSAERLVMLMLLSAHPAGLRHGEIVARLSPEQLDAARVTPVLTSLHRSGLVAHEGHTAATRWYCPAAREAHALRTAAGYVAA